MRCQQCRREALHPRHGPAEVRTIGQRVHMQMRPIPARERGVAAAVARPANGWLRAAVKSRPGRGHNACPRPEINSTCIDNLVRPTAISSLSSRVPHHRGATEGHRYLGNLNWPPAHLPLDHGADAVREGLLALFGSLPGQARHTLTWDQGVELAHHEQIAPLLGDGGLLRLSGKPSRGAICSW